MNGLNSAIATSLHGIGPRILKKANNILSPSIAAFLNKNYKKLSKIKGADASLLPSSKPVLHQKLLRTILVAYVWKNADRTVPLEMDPAECGWVLQDNSFRLKWFDGDQIPDNVGKAIDESPDDDESDDDYRYSLMSDDSGNEDDTDI